MGAGGRAAPWPAERLPPYCVVQVLDLELYARELLLGVPVEGEAWRGLLQGSFPASQGTVAGRACSSLRLGRHADAHGSAC